MSKLKPCGCGRIPKTLGIFAGNSSKYAWVLGDCCGDWCIEFKTHYKPLGSAEAMKLATEAWNNAERAADKLHDIEYIGELKKQAEEIERLKREGEEERIKYTDALIRLSKAEAENKNLKAELEELNDIFEVDNEHYVVELKKKDKRLKLENKKLKEKIAKFMKIIEVWKIDEMISLWFKQKKSSLSGIDEQSKDCAEFVVKKIKKALEKEEK